MGKLIYTTLYAVDSQPITNPFTSACIQAFQADDVIFARAATTAQKQAVPAASGSINTAITFNYDLNNAGERHVWLVGESVQTLINNS